MSISFPINGVDVTVYTDGLCFNTSSNNPDSNNFFLKSGIWTFPFEYRICVYSAQEIFNNTNFLYIQNKITVKPNIFIYLEKELEIEPVLKNMDTEIYYDMTFHNQDSLFKLLKVNLNLIDSGNLLSWKNKLQLIDELYS